MDKDITHVGMDVHKKEIVVAMLVPDGEAPEEWRLANESRAVRRLAKRLKRAAPGKVVCAYEAGACGYVLQRQLGSEGIRCQVVAPSLIPRKPGERIKTDRRDARKLAELLRAGLLTEVHPPSEEEEAVRDLCRCREDCKQDLMRARHRLSKMLLRRGVRYGLGRPWTQRHRSWLWSLEHDHAATKATFEDYMLAITHLETRLKELDAKLESLMSSASVR